VNYENRAIGVNDVRNFNKSVSLPSSDNEPLVVIPPHRESAASVLHHAFNFLDGNAVLGDLVQVPVDSAEDLHGTILYNIVSLESAHPEAGRINIGETPMPPTRIMRS